MDEKFSRQLCSTEWIDVFEEFSACLLDIKTIMGELMILWCVSISAARLLLGAQSF